MAPRSAWGVYPKNNSNLKRPVENRPPHRLSRPRPHSGGTRGRATATSREAEARSGGGVRLCRVFWADHLKLEVYSSLSSSAASEATRLAAAQEHVIRRDVLLKNVLAHASTVDVLDPAVVAQIFREADESDAPLFRFVDEGVLASLAEGLGLEGVPAATGASSSSDREALLGPILSWALSSEDIVMPQDFEDMQFSWTFKDQPYVARRAAWRTVVSIDPARSEEARVEAGASLARPPAFGGAPVGREDPFCGNAMTRAAFEIGLEGADRAVLVLDTGAEEDESVEIGPDHLGALRAAVLRYLKAGAGARGWIFDDSSLVGVRRAQGEGVEISFGPLGGGATIVASLAQSSDLRCLLDLLDFVGSHERTLSSFTAAGSLAEYEDLNETAVYGGAVRARKVGGIAKIAASAIVGLALVWAAANRNSSMVKGLLHRAAEARRTFSSAYAEKYQRAKEERRLDLVEQTEVPASSLRRNRAAAAAMASSLKARAESSGCAGVDCGGKELRYQAVLARSGVLKGFSPANVEAIRRWQDVSGKIGFEVEKVKETLRAEEAFVFLVKISEEGGVSVEAWE